VCVQVNGHDLTVVTHKKAVEYIGRKTVLNLIVYRKGVPQLYQQRPTGTSSARQPAYDYSLQQQQQQKPQSVYQTQQPYPPVSSIERNVQQYGPQSVSQSQYQPQSQTTYSQSNRPYAK
jgi:hypothetical protein